MKNKKKTQENPHSVVEQMGRTVRTVEKDDLAGMAKLHHWCQTLLDCPTIPGQDSAPKVQADAREAAALLEAVILGETQDPDLSLASAIQKIDELVQLVQAACPGDEGPVTKAPPSVATDSTANAQSSDETADAPQAADLATGVVAEYPCVPEGEPPTWASATETSTGDSVPAEVRPEPGVEQNEILPPMPDRDSGIAEPPGDEQPAARPAEASVAEVPSSAAEAAAPPYEQVPLIIDAKELEFLKGFVEEAREHIEAIEAALLEVERTPDDPDCIGNLFRPFHTIKGMAGFLNLRDINCLTHEAETLLDQGRKGQRRMTAGFIDLIFDVVDILKAQVEAISAFTLQPGPDPVPQPPIVDMIAKLRAVVAGKMEPQGSQSGARDGQKVGDNLVAQGACPREVVDFALQVQEGTAGPQKKTGEILMDLNVVSARQVDQAIRSQKADAASPDRAAAAATPAAGTGPGGGKAASGDSSVRIDTTKLDSLVDLVGELVIAQTLITANPLVASDPKLLKDAGQVSKIVRDVQELAMSMRMVPIGPTFQKMARLVRDVSRKANKNVELHIAGEDTELDKNVIQQIGDPLVHMVRNAVDHGVEPPDVRRAAGKDETGHVYLSAFHQGGNIVVEIRDDGRGLDPRKLIAKGIEKGLVQPGEELTDQEAFNLIFAAGFSTAEQVTDISGRGVGMDVVRRNIEQLRGRVDITSELGRGTTFSIRLPLTLAIIDGMVVKVASERFIIPTITIDQSLKPTREQISTVQRRGELVNVRGQLIPVIQLGALFGLKPRVDPCEAMVIIANCEGRRIGLVVDELIGQQQVVIKTLGERFEKLRGICGAAILGDGRVGLILEMSGLAQAHKTALQETIGGPAASPPSPLENSPPSSAPAGQTTLIDSPSKSEEVPVSV